MSATVKSKDKSPSTTQKILRKLHLGYSKYSNTAEQNTRTDDANSAKTITELQKGHISKRWSVLLPSCRQEQSVQETAGKEATNEYKAHLIPNEAEKNCHLVETNQTPMENQSNPPTVTTVPAQSLNNHVSLEKILPEEISTSEVKIDHEPEDRDKDRIGLPLSLPPVTLDEHVPEFENSPESNPPTLETRFEQPPVVHKQRLRAASSLSPINSMNHSTCPAHCVKQRPISCVDLTEDDYLAFKRCVYDLSDTCNSLSRKMNHHRIHKRISQETCYVDLPAIPSSLNEYTLLCHQGFQKQGTCICPETHEPRARRSVHFEDVKPTIDNSVQEIKNEGLQSSLDKERAMIKALQKQKEACYRDIEFLSQNIEELKVKNTEMKKKLDSEKVAKEKLRYELSSITGKLDESSHYVRKLEDQNSQLALEKSTKDKEIKELKRNSKLGVSEGSKSNDRLLTAQLRHSQNQVRLLKSTIEQFLRMGLFQEDSGNSSGSASPSTSIELLVPDLKAKQRSRQSLLAQTKTISKKAGEEESEITKTPGSSAKQDIKKSIEKSSEKSLSEKKQTEKRLSEKRNEMGTSDLDKKMRELSREKEILQAEYSKAPSTGNALLRKRREEVETRLDSIDSEMNRIKLKIRSKKSFEKFL